MKTIETMKAMEVEKNDLHLNNLYLRYFFNRDVGDLSRANYWLSRIKEYEQLNKK